MPEPLGTIKYKNLDDMGIIQLKNYLLILLVIFIHSVELFGTSQIPDKIIIKGEIGILQANPLYPYLKKHKKKGIPGLHGYNSSACWRGYVATWLIENDSLFLTQIAPCDPDNGDKKNSNADLEEMFGKKYRNEKVFAKWYSGEIKNPVGICIRRSDLQFLYEYDRIFKIRNGKVKSHQMFSNYTPRMNSIVRTNITTSELYLLENLNKSFIWDNMEIPIDSIIKSGIHFDVAKDGTILTMKCDDINCNNSIKDSLISLKPFKLIHYKEIELKKHISINLVIDFKRREIYDKDLIRRFKIYKKYN